MIAFVSGAIAALGPDGAVVEVGGVGLEVQCTPGTLASLRVGEPARLATSLVVREDSLTLYGFADDDERAVFELLQTASGVGPRLAQAMLAVHSPNALRRAVATEDLGALCLVPGIGKKGAQRIVLELKDRLGVPEPRHGFDPVEQASTADGRGAPGAPLSLPLQRGWREQIHGALVGLGWTAREADEALIAVAPEVDAAAERGETPDVAVLLRSALRALGRS
ncbi:MAG TPA: Holliday junction branch migration protein RuvA [Actinomycetes bacterium]|nr:Holliday junction branch migration protein RuvA [Actinomycetes bacterium]